MSSVTKRATTLRTARRVARGDKQQPLDAVCSRAFDRAFAHRSSRAASMQRNRRAAPTTNERAKTTKEIASLAANLRINRLTLTHIQEKEKYVNNVKNKTKRSNNETKPAFFVQRVFSRRGNSFIVLKETTLALRRLLFGNFHCVETKKRKISKTKQRNNESKEIKELNRVSHVDCWRC